MVVLTWLSARLDRGSRKLATCCSTPAGISSIFRTWGTPEGAEGAGGNRLRSMGAVPADPLSSRIAASPPRGDDETPADEREGE
ncbi:glycerol kinase [Ralstonia solanacearum]|nr:glycerol kinase [Ralstonia solanacearum]